MELAERWQEAKSGLDPFSVLDGESSSLSPTPGTPSCAPRLCPLSFGEGVEFDPLPPKEIRYTSSVKYDSDKHFVDNIFLPVGLEISSCSQTVFCVPDCTWRSYRAELYLEPRNKPSRFVSTTIVYPKYTKTIYTTTLDYNCRKYMRRFLSSVELEATEFPGNDCFLDDY
uniref:Refilin-B isoform X2 n=1 Tax=Geotrypetes seraphini TaxID=260995 RepID=A0A6P8NNW9_GEOSA|nr:refilin-B isoform X2 [Geotrypetes seraphini]